MSTQRFLVRQFLVWKLTLINGLGPPEHHAGHSILTKRPIQVKNNKTCIVESADEINLSKQRRCMWKLIPSKKRDSWADRPSKYQVRGWIAVSAEALQGKGLCKTKVCFIFAHARTGNVDLRLLLSFQRPACQTLANNMYIYIYICNYIYIYIYIVPYLILVYTICVYIHICIYIYIYIYIYAYIHTHTYTHSDFS